MITSLPPLQKERSSTTDNKCAQCEYALKATTKACSECLGCYNHDKFVKHEMKNVWDYLLHERLKGGTAA